MPKIASLILAGSSIALASLLSGCDGGPEEYVYRSEVYSPKTITLRDITTGEELLNVDVPPGQQLNMRFESTKEQAEKTGQDTLRWNVGPWGEKSYAKSNVVKVPPASSRRIEMTLRPVPEPRPLGGN